MSHQMSGSQHFRKNVMHMSLKVKQSKKNYKLDSMILMMMKPRSFKMLETTH